MLTTEDVATIREILKEERERYDDDSTLWEVYGEAHRHLLYATRDAIDHALAALDAFQRWEPVEDYKLYGRPHEERFVRVIASGGILKTQYGFGDKRRTMTVSLPNDIRLCRLVTTGRTTGDATGGKRW